MNKLLYTIALSVLIAANGNTQSCTSTVYYDNMETFTWFGDWFTYSFSNFFTNFSISPSASAVHYGSGTGSSGIEQDWYVLPLITGLNPNYTYKVKFRLASYTATSPSASTRGLDGADYLQVQLSRNGGAYSAEMTIRGFNNQTWTYAATGVAAKTANGTNTIYQIATGGARADGFSTVELTLQPGTTSVAVDIYTRCNSSGEEFWIDNIEFIEIIPTIDPEIMGNAVVCLGDSTTLIAVGGDVFSWSGGISNNISFLPTTTTTYNVTATLNGMVNGDGNFNVCSVVDSIEVFVDENCALPIYLRSFDGQASNYVNVLNWVTEQEINSSHFDIERSVDGMNFVKIGNQLADQRLLYVYIDSMPFDGYNYYRLRMVDLDGSFAYSSTIVIQSIPKSHEYIFYPNPLEDIINYVYYDEFPEDLIITVFNLSGKQVYSSMIPCIGCYNRVAVDLSFLPAGHYILQVYHSNTHNLRHTIIRK